MPADDLVRRVSQKLLRAVVPGDNFHATVDSESRVGSEINEIASLEHHTPSGGLVQ
jgi:hypothetical protein